MATFKSQYSTSELLNLLKRSSLTYYYWSLNNGEYTFYFVDNRRHPYMDKGFISFVSHRSNYFRLRNKVKNLPFRLCTDPWFKKDNTYLFTLFPDSVFLNVDSEYRLNLLNKITDGKFVVNVVVI